MVEISGTKVNSSIRGAIIICALGYFMDVFDYNLFTVLRVPSLSDLGISPDTQSTVASHILNAQLSGILLGAFLWGYLGDRYGRLKTLYGSIFIYSAATLGCSLVHDPMTYAFLRFWAGFGIAGEVGAATTVVAELMHPQKRGWGIAIIAGIGCFAPAIAVLSAWFLNWRIVYILAGFAGLTLLVLRMRLAEPALFKKISAENCNRGSLRFLLQPEKATIFICCILIGGISIFSNWFLNFFSLEISRSVLAHGEIFNQKLCFLLFYTATSCGDFIAGAISQLWGSRRKTIVIFLLMGVVVSIYFLVIAPMTKMTAPILYLTYFALGVMGGGCLVLIFTTAAEHFGTNIRATTAITINNIQRGCSIPMIFAFQGLQHVMSVTNAAAVIAVVLYLMAFLALRQLRETHGLDLDYVERLERPLPKT